MKKVGFLVRIEYLPPKNILFLKKKKKIHALNLFIIKFYGLVIVRSKDIYEC